MRRGKTRDDEAARADAEPERGLSPTALALEALRSGVVQSSARRRCSETREDAADPVSPGPPFPQSLCHDCSAPPRYVESDRGSVFIYCPTLGRYPPQPVVECPEFRARQAAPR